MTFCAETHFRCARLRSLPSWPRLDPASGLTSTSKRTGPTVFAHACKLGLEGIVPKRRNSPYRSGRSPDWIKSKNPDAPAVRREAEEDWGR